MNQAIKAICFDLDGVYFTARGKQSFHRALIKEFGGEKAAVDGFMRTSETMRDFACGRVSVDAFFNELRVATGASGTDDELIARWIRDYEIDARVRQAVQSARAQGYRTCVCTNNNAARLPALETKYGFYQDFDVVVSSHEVGYTKPSLEIFNELLTRIGVAASELVYADDNPDRLQGARDVGITTFVFEDFEQFVRELKTLGVTL